MNLSVHRNKTAARAGQTGIDGGKNINMKIKVKTKHDAVLAEGTYNTAVSSVTPKPTEAQPTKILLGFKVDGYQKELIKENPASFNAGSPLRADAETILSRSFTHEEDKSGFELNTLIGLKCQVVVFHKAGSGGRPKPTVSLVLPAA